MKKIRMLLPTGAVIGMLVVGTAFPAMAAADSDTAKFVRGTTINAVDVSKQTAQQAKGYLEGYFNEHYEIKIQDADGNLEVLKGTDVGYHLNVTGSVDDILKEQNDTGRKTGPGSDQSYTCLLYTSNSRAFDKAVLTDDLKLCIKRKYCVHMTLYKNRLSATGTFSDADAIAVLVDMAVCKSFLLKHLKKSRCFFLLMVRRCRDQGKLNLCLLYTSRCV